MRKFILLSTMVVMPVTVLAASDEVYTNTHTYTPIELSSISPVSNQGIKLASVCFLGVGDCDPNITYGKGDDYTVDSAKQCQNEGFIKNNCNAVQIPDGICPYNSAYIKGCKCKPGLLTCTSPKFGVGDSCGGQYASCKCPATVSLSNTNDRCTQYCDGNCIAKTCTASNSETGCSYGTTSCSNGCGGTRSCCKSCSPSRSETGCAYGTYTCGDGCGGNRQCCNSCTPARSESSCAYGTYTCGDGCGGYRNCCSTPPPPPPPSNPWKYSRFMTGSKYCYQTGSTYTIQCDADMYCRNSNTGEKKYICRKSYGLGKNCRSNNWDTLYSSLSECNASINSCSCSGNIGDNTNMGDCDSSGSHSCSW